MISDRSLRAIIASERRSSRHPEGASCVDCTTPLTVLFVVGSDPTICIECLARQQGRPTTEQHALGGLPSPLVVEIGLNLHALCTLAAEMTWRAWGFAPGSPEATFVDLLALEALKGWVQ